MRNIRVRGARGSARPKILAFIRPHFPSGPTTAVQVDENCKLFVRFVTRTLMATITPTDAVKVSTEASEAFVDAYYTCQNSSRQQLASFYVPSTAATAAPGRALPCINYNGELVTDAADFQERFENQMPWAHYEPQSVNAHVLNPCAGSTSVASKSAAERNMSICVQVSGYVRLGERKAGPMRGFSESFVLVPNKEETGGRGTGKTDHGRRWLIQSQNFRFVV